MIVGITEKDIARIRIYDAMAYSFVAVFNRKTTSDERLSWFASRHEAWDDFIWRISNYHYQRITFSIRHNHVIDLQRGRVLGTTLFLFFLSTIRHLSTESTDGRLDFLLLNSTKDVGVFLRTWVSLCNNCAWNGSMPCIWMDSIRAAWAWSKRLIFASVLLAIKMVCLMRSQYGCFTKWNDRNTHSNDYKLTLNIVLRSFFGSW